MKLTQIALRTFAMSLLLVGALAQAQFTGTVTDKTTGKPAVGDNVVLVDPQAGMGEVARSTTDAKGHYALTAPGSGNYLVRVTHGGAPYFIAAPKDNAQGDIPVYDVAAKVTGVYCEADVMELEAANGQLRVTERYFVHNTSTPPTTQWSARSFEVVLPVDAVVEDAAAQRPTGLPTSIKLDPAGAKGHYAFNFPIQPDDGQKSTLFQFSYDVPYSSGSFTFKPLMTLPTQSVGVLLPKSMTFTAGGGSVFQSVPEDPTVQTVVAKNALPGKALEFTVSGTGSIPREDQSSQQGQPQDNGSANGSGSDASTGQPGGGLGAPIGTPDPLSKYKWWILSGFGLLLVVAAAFLLRKPAPGMGIAAGAGVAGAGTVSFAASAAVKSPALLNALKEELFALESEKISGSLGAAEYAEAKAALEIVLKRALKRNA